MLDLYLITPQRPADAVATLCARALAGVGGELRVGLQLRAGQLSASARHALAMQLRRLTRQHGVRLLINAEVELARQVGADGVQLPERGPDPASARRALGGGALLIASRHDLAGLEAAHAAGADAATLSPVFAVDGKGAPLGIDGFAQVAARAPLPLIALGGLGAGHVAALRSAGAHGVAVIRSVFDAQDPAASVRELCHRLSAHPRQP